MRKGALFVSVVIGIAGMTNLAVAQPWNGFYFGVQGGAGWGLTALEERSFQVCDATFTVCTPTFSAVPGAAVASYPLSGWHGGGTIGFNFVNGPVGWSRLLLGLEGDISAADINGKGDCTFASAPLPSFGLQTGCRTKLDWFATLTPRLGLTFDHVLVYVKGGVAWGHFDHDITSGFSSGFPVIAGQRFSLSDTRTGGTAGTGIEYAFSRHLSGKIEYDYMDFGTEGDTFRSTNNIVFGFRLHENVRETEHIIRAGLNYRFGGDEWAPLK